MRDRPPADRAVSRSTTSNTKHKSIKALESEVAYRTRLQGICNKINSALHLDEILIDLKDEITSLFRADRVTVYVVDVKTHELVSRFKSMSEIEEIRVPISRQSIAGWCALKNQIVNINDAYDDNELASIDPELRFDKRWDAKTGFRTQQVLAHPIVFNTLLLGVIQIMNRNVATSFRQLDEQSLKEVADILGIALYNQKRLTQRFAMGKFDALIENHLLSQPELERAIVSARQKRLPIESILMGQYNISKKSILHSLGRFYNTKTISFNPQISTPKNLLAGLKVAFLRNNCWVPVHEKNGKLAIAIDNPHDLQRIAEIKALYSKKKLDFYVALKQDILAHIKRCAGDDAPSSDIEDILSQMREEVVSFEETENFVNEDDSAVVKLVNTMIQEAYQRGASDIHIEPFSGKDNTQIRFRIDGDCLVYQTIPFSYRNAVVSRIKIMSDLDIAERRKPQDGKIKFKKFGKQEIELRVATIPTHGGLEDVVMRILDGNEPLPLKSIGFSQKNYENFISAISNPYGIIFVCGPTGSGKTTTLHSALKHLNKIETKIWTAEDPVEITQKGLRQVQVKPQIGYDFAAAMRSFLRADPDVIMVGEMRDQETISIGIQASLTGHLVLSTLHTNSAPESISRLLDMGMDPFNFSDSILCILAQRLARTLCKNCRRSFHPTSEEYSLLAREFGNEDMIKRTGISFTAELKLNKAVGCESCNQKGYLGRMALHELLMGTDDIKHLIQNKAKINAVRDQALRDGMTTLKQDGIEKIFAGYLDLLQVRKVCIK